MRINRRSAINSMVLLSLMAGLTIVSTRLQADTETTGTCGGSGITIPFTDVSPSNVFFCSIASAFFSGLTNGTTATTYSPTQPVLREQMAAFITRTLDQSLRRGSRRAALGQWWTSRNPAGHHMISVGNAPQFLVSDGEHVYVSNTLSDNVIKVQASTGSRLDTIANGAMSDIQGVLVAAGYVWYAGFFSSSGTYGITFEILDRSGGGAVSIAGTNPLSLTCDGANIWSANLGTGPNTGSITRVNIAQPSSSTTFTAGFNRPFSIIFDGAWLWVTDQGDNSLKRVNPATGAVEQTIPIGNIPGLPTFDGTNLWVPVFGDGTVKVVRAVGGLQGTVLETLTSGAGPLAAAFDGERVLVTNFSSHHVSLYKATDLTLIGTFPMPEGSGPTGVCSDGVKFWVTLQNIDKIVSF